MDAVIHERKKAKASFLEAASKGRDLKPFPPQYADQHLKLPDQNSVDEDLPLPGHDAEYKRKQRASKLKYEALQLAAHNGHAQFVRHLLLSSSTAVLHHDWCLKMASREVASPSPLYLAVKEGHLPVVKEIIDYFKREQALTILTLGSGSERGVREWFQGLVEWAVHCGHASIVDNLLSQPALAPLPVVPLHLAAYKKDQLELLKILLSYQFKNKLKVPQFSEDGLTALHLAAQSGSLSAVKLLMTRQSVVKKSNPELFTPLHMAANSGHAEVVEFLLLQTSKMNLDPTARDCMGRTALHYAAQEGHDAVVRQLLNTPGIRIHGNMACIADHDGLLPLHMAARNGHVEVIRCLSPHGGLNARAKNSTQMREYVQREFMGRGMFRMYCHYFGQKWRFSRPQLINSIFWRTEGFTPLHFAARHGHIAAVTELLKQRANREDSLELQNDALFMKDSQGFLAYDWMKLVHKQGRKFLRCLSNLHKACDHKLVVKSVKQASCCNMRVITEGHCLKMAAEIGQEKDVLKELWQAWERVKYPRPPIRKCILEWLEDERSRFYWLHWAVEEGDMDLLHSLLVLKDFDINEKDAAGVSPLNKAFGVRNESANQQLDLIKALLLHPRTELQDARPPFITALLRNNLVAAKELALFKPAVISDYRAMEMVKDLAQSADSSRCRDEWESFVGALVVRQNRMNASHLRFFLAWARRWDLHGIVLRILDRPDLKRGLYKDRQVYLDCANAILVGATLIAGVTFEGWLQPPLGYIFRYEEENYADLHDGAGVRLFWWFNNGAFFFAVAALTAGARGAVPMAEKLSIGESVEKVRTAVAVASMLLGMALVCVVGAFVAAGYAIVPPLEQDLAIMQTSVIWGASTCALMLLWFYRSIWPHYSTVRQQLAMLGSTHTSGNYLISLVRYMYIKFRAVMMASLHTVFFLPFVLLRAMCACLCGSHNNHLTRILDNLFLLGNHEPTILVSYYRGLEELQSMSRRADAAASTPYPLNPGRKSRLAQVI